MDKQYPLIIVFYLDRALMRQTAIMGPFADSINEMLIKKEANTIALFLPTDGEERVECINPIIVKPADMEKINNIIEDIKKNFDVNPEIKLKVEEVDADEPCVCKKNEDGTCDCV